MKKVKARGRPSSVAQHRQQTQVRLILGGLLILLAVGGGLAWLFYGHTAALTALLCLAVAAGLFGLLWLILALLGALVRDDEP